MLCRSLLFLLCVYPLISFAQMTAPTQIKYYRPFGVVIDQIDEVKGGTCSQQSRRIIREDAWRCVAEEKTYDPCFMKPGKDEKSVLCPQSPWSEKGVSLSHPNTIANKNFKTLNIAMAYPWAVELWSGITCLATDGDKELEGSTIHYQCADQTVLFGYLQRCKEEWSTLQQTSDGKVLTVWIKRAWF